jgi:3-hydroxyacyl-[acyl-carrier-protein] dehydratase
MGMDFQQVNSVLPQKFPLIMVDKGLERVAGERIVCVKNVTGNEMVFLGHFPGYAIFPGVYITEALAQSAILLFKDEDTQDTDSLYLLYSTKMTFKSVVVPGDQMRMEIETQKATKLGIIVDAKAYVDDKVVAKGELIFSVKKSEDI